MTFELKRKLFKGETVDIGLQQTDKIQLAPSEC